MSIDGLIEAYDTRTGYVTRVPAHFIGDPMVGRFLAKTPEQLFLDSDLIAPTPESTIPELKEFAAAVGLDVTGLKAKDDLLAAVRTAIGGEDLPTKPDPNAPTDPDATPVTDETPASGEGVN